MAPPPCRPRPTTTTTLPGLMEELIEEILIRIAPDEPAHLVRAALVCKPWRRILTGPGFLHRYRAFHGAPPPLLGYLYNLGHDNRDGIPMLAPTTSTASPLPMTLPEPELERLNWVLDCRHGRVLIHALRPYGLVVWDPTTGGQKNLSLPGYDHVMFAGTVLCAMDGCDHLNCWDDGPFLVVFAGSDVDGGNDNFETWVAIYSFETGLWSAKISIQDTCVLRLKPPLLIRDTLYFSAEGNIILKCDLGAHELSLIESPGEFSHDNNILMEVDGGLGFVSMEGNCLHRLSWRGDANSGTGGWTQDLVMELNTLLPTHDPFCPHDVVGLLEGTNIVFISVSGVGLFALDLKSRELKKIGERGNYYVVLPYTSFYTPDLANRISHHLHEDAKIEPPP